MDESDRVFFAYCDQRPTSLKLHVAKALFRSTCLISWQKVTVGKRWRGQTQSTIARWQKNHGSGISWGDFSLYNEKQIATQCHATCIISIRILHGGMLMSIESNCYTVYWSCFFWHFQVWALPKIGYDDLSRMSFHHQDGCNGYLHTTNLGCYQKYFF